MMNIKVTIASLFSAALSVVAIVSCTDVENVEVQKPYTYSEQYYQNLRDYKASEHQVSFMWFADYSSSHSLGIRFLGLPDSLDICSLWGGIPSDVEGKPNTFYNPKAYEEMRFVQKVKGVKMTYVTFPGVNNNKWLEEYLPDANTDEGALALMKAYGDSLLRIVYDNDLDGVDLDYEIDGDWMHDRFYILIEYLGQHIGPKGKDPSKMLLVDGGPFPGETKHYEYLTYFVSQSYGVSSPSTPQYKFDEMRGRLPSEKFIITENMGDYYSTGGVPFTEADGNQYTETGERLGSLEGMARWNPTQGRKGGFGAFFGQRDYNNNPPYKYFRRGIQAQNPAIK